MFSAIDSRCVPRAQVKVSAGGRSGSASQLSTPAVSACAHRSFGICGSRPAGAPHANIASVSARCAWFGVSLRASASTFTRLLRSAVAIASRYAVGVSVHSRTRVLSEQQSLLQHAVDTFFTIHRLRDMKVHRKRAELIGLFAR